MVRVTSYVFRQDVLCEKTRISGLPSGVDFLVMGSDISIQSLLACENTTDRQTERNKGATTGRLGVRTPKKFGWTTPTFLMKSVITVT